MFQLKFAEGPGNYLVTLFCQISWRSDVTQIFENFFCHQSSATDIYRADREGDLGLISVRDILLTEKESFIKL